MIKNKKGSNVGMVLSFTIFITSLLVIYSLIGSPFDASVSKQNSISSLDQSVMNMIESNTLIVRATNPGNDSCYSIKTPQNNFVDLTYVATDVSGNEVASYVSPTETFFSNQTNSTKIYYSNSSFIKTINQTSTACSPANISSVEFQKRVLEKNIIWVINQTDKNYLNFKSQVDLGAGDDFNILFDYRNGTVLGSNSSEPQTNIYSDEFNVNYISLSGKEKTGGLILKVW